MCWFYVSFFGWVFTEEKLFLFLFSTNELSLAFFFLFLISIGRFVCVFIYFFFISTRLELIIRFSLRFLCTSKGSGLRYV